MAKKQINPGYERAIAAIAEKQGRAHGAVSWLAEKLGVSRQSINYWKVSGFPAVYIPKVAKLTGLPETDLDSRTIVLRIPELAWDGICSAAPKSLTNQAVNITRRN